MTVNERAARLYLRGTMTLDQIADRCWLTSAQALHAIALYKAEHRDTHPECEHCKPSKNALDRWGPHQFPIDDGAIYYYDVDDGWEGEEINFCPWCGRPLTDEAWAELERRVCGG